MGANWQNTMVYILYLPWKLGKNKKFIESAETRIDFDIVSGTKNDEWDTGTMCKGRSFCRRLWIRYVV